MRIQLSREYVHLGGRALDTRFLTLGLLISILLSVATISTYYHTTKRPLSRLPGVQSLTYAVAPGFQFAFYGVSSPFGVAVSQNGERIYVTETSGERQIRAFDRNGNQLVAFSPPGTTAGLRMPMYVAVDDAGKVYVTDRLRASVDVYDADGRYLNRFPKDNPNLIQQPLAISFDKAGNIYVTDVAPGQHRVLVFDRAGNLQLGFGREGAGRDEFTYPNGVAASNSRIFVSDSNNGRLSVFGSDGTPLTVFGSGSGDGTVGIPRGLVLEDNRRLYAVDTISHLVNAYDVSGEQIKFLFSFGQGGIEQGQFTYPNGIAIDARGRIYVTDRENHRVHVWDY